MTQTHASHRITLRDLASELIGSAGIGVDVVASYVRSTFVNTEVSEEEQADALATLRELSSSEDEAAPPQPPPPPPVVDGLGLRSVR